MEEKLFESCQLQIMCSELLGFLIFLWDQKWQLRFQKKVNKNSALFNTLSHLYWIIKTLCLISTFQSGRLKMLLCTVGGYYVLYTALLISKLFWTEGCMSVDSFGPKWHSLRSLPFQGPKKSRFSGPTLSNAPFIDVGRLKTIKYKRHINNRYIGNFMYTNVLALLCVVVCCWLLLCVGR
jgi:hypothetical protein